MKKILSIILIFAPLFVNAQSDKITEVCGVKFGSSLTSAKPILKERFGEPFYETENNLTYALQNYGGIGFHYIKFDFTKNGSRTYLNEVNFMSFFATKADAEEHNKQLTDVVRRNYSLTQKTKDSYRIYCGGGNPLNSGLPGFSIYVYKHSNVELPWSSRIAYGPYGYGDNF